MNHQNIDQSHKTILKATGVFGMVQFVKMFISIIGSKFVAIFLGPIGIGTVGLLNNTLSIISSLTSFGISTTSVREIAASESENNPSKVTETIYIIQKMALAIGLFGAILAIVLSPLLSQWTFGNSNKYYWFVILSINFFLTSFTASRVAILQGKRLLKIIAVSNVVSSLIVTFATVLLYYFYRFDGIVSVIIVSGIINLCVNLYYTRSYKTNSISLSFSEFYQKSLPIFKLGFLLSINSIFGLICTFIIKLYLNQNGATSQILGFYEVSTVILISYVGLIFNAMAMDFYPRLTALSFDNLKVKNYVNNQIEIALLLVTPAIILLYLVGPLVIELLYSKEFLLVFEIFKVALFAIIVKAIIWPLGFIILAKGNKKQYFKQELVSDFLNVSLTLFLYNWFGLIGIGIASVLHFSFYGIYVYFVVRKLYQFSFRNNTLFVIVVSLFVGLSALFAVVFLEIMYAKMVCGILLIVAIIYSYRMLNKLISIKEYWLKFKAKFSK